MLRQIQDEAGQWREHNFPPADRTAAMQTLGVCEESGELAHAVLKDAQGIRGTHEEHLAEAKDAAGDIVIYLCGVADAMGFDLATAVETAWAQVKDRDWTQHKMTGLKTIVENTGTLHGIEEPQEVVAEVPTGMPTQHELLQAQIDDPAVDSSNIEGDTPMAKAMRALATDDVSDGSTKG